MEVIKADEIQHLEGPLAVAIGFFDGIHLGHQAVIKQAVDYAKKAEIASLVITFDRSPKQAFQNLEMSYLTPIREKAIILSRLGVHKLLVLPFNEQLINTSAEDFIQNYLIALDVEFISVGFDFRFGTGAIGDVSTLLDYGDKFKMTIVGSKNTDGTKISSTQLRKSLTEGDVATASKLLGRNYQVKGRVVKGNQLGRTIGFATANIELEDQYVLPKPSVYATMIHVDGNAYASMTNIGHNPTFNATSELSIETHILDFEADIYDKNVQLDFIERIRDEQKFTEIDELVAALEQDKAKVRGMKI